ncbi:unnamed protein product [Lampetra fluviatilis]
MALLPKTPSPLLPAIVLLALVASASAASLTVETHRHEPGSVGAAPHDLPHRNLTLGGGSDEQQLQPIVFHHVYNINVPPGSLCAVDLDAGPPDGAGFDSRSVVGSGSGDGDIGGGESDLGTFTQKTHETGGQVVFTHRISIPKRACGCSTEGLPDLRELVRRVELMEQEISSLRQQCSSAACCGAAPGAVDIASPCNGHGTFSTESCGCVCDKGWTGKTCSQPACPSDCGGRGTCVDGVCDCEEGFGGPDCGQATCLNDCSNRGVCVNGVCVCERGFVGADCSQPGCPNDCNGRGRCVDGKCLCARGFSGEDCRESRPKDLKVDDVKDTTAQLSWTSPSALVDGLVLTYGPTRPGARKTEVPLQPTVTEHALQGLRPGVHYIVILHSVRGPQMSDKQIQSFVTDSADELHITDITPYSMKVSWVVDPKLFERFIVRYKPADSSETPLEKTLPGEVSTIDLTDLTEDTTYTVELIGYRRGKPSKPLVAQVRTGVPVVSANELHITEIAPNSVKVSWVVDPNVFDHFIVQYTPTASTEKPLEKRLPGQVSTVDLLDLTENTEYTIKLIGYRRKTPSKPLMALVTTGISVTSESGVPIDSANELLITDITPDSMKVSWVVDPNVFDRFLVRYKPTDSSEPPLETFLAGHITSIDISGLTENTEYEVTLLGSRLKKYSKPLKTKVITVSGVPTDSADELVISDITPDSFKVSWVVDPEVFDKFILEVESPDSTIIPLKETVPGDITSVDLTDLKENTEYVVRLIASRKGKLSRPLTAKVTTVSGVPTDSADELAISDITTDSMKVSWVVDPKVFDRFIVQYKPTDSPEKTLEKTLPGHLSTVDLTELTENTEYTVKLIGYKKKKPSKPLVAQVTTGIDGAKNLQVVSVTDSTMDIEWENTQSPIDHYTVHYSTSSGDPPGDIKVYKSPQPTTKTTITGLQPGTEYMISVVALKGNKGSAPASTTGRTVIDGPKDLQVTNSSDTTISLSWTAPSTSFDRYTITFASETSDDGREVTVPADATTATLSDLEPGTKYAIRLRAEKGSVHSAWAFTSGKTGCKPATAMRFSDITPTSLVASWASPPATPDYYIVKYSQRNREPHTVAVSGGQNYVVLSDLKPDTEYRVRVISVKGVSSSKPLIGDVFTAIETPRNIDFKDIRETSVVVTWIAPSADADSFKIAYVPTAGGEPESRRVASSLTEVMLTRLTPGTEYEVNVISVKSFQESDPLTGTFTTLLGSPSVLSAEDVTDSSALLKWKPTIGPVDTYSLTYSFEDGEPVTVTVSGGTVEYQLTDLNPDTPYVAKVRAVKGAQQSADTAVAFVTARKKTSFPMDCSEALQGDQSSGVFTIFLNGNASQPLLVYCDMTTDGGGWIVVQRRQNGLTDFFRNWKAYEKGFGDINDEFWLGLQNIFALTSQGRYELRVDLRDGEWGAHAVYDHFSVANASGLYRLKVGEYSGTAGDSMTYHQGRPFSTVDRDNDVAITNCAISYHGAWWYKNCHRANLNGKYGDKSHSQGVNWYHWKGHEYSVPFVEMKIRPFAAAKRGSRQHLRN